MPLIPNLVAFQLNWLACVLGAAHGVPCLGIGGTAALIGIHLAWVARPALEFKLILLAGLLGGVLDSLLIGLGLLSFPSGTVVEGLAPHWIIAMWMAFATTLNVGFRWLRGRRVLAALLGAAGGPLAYYAGSELGGVNLTSPVASLAALAFTWSLAMPLLTALSVRLDGTVQTDRKRSAHCGSDTAGRPA